MSRLPSVGCGPLGDELADPTHPPAGRVGVVAEFLCHPAGAAAGGGGQHDGVTAEDGGDGRGVVLPAVGGLMSTVAVPLISQLNSLGATVCTMAYSANITQPTAPTTAATVLRVM